MGFCSTVALNRKQYETIIKTIKKEKSFQMKESFLLINMQYITFLKKLLNILDPRRSVILFEDFLPLTYMKVQEILQHSSPVCTRKYIGISPQRVEDALVANVNLVSGC